MNHNFVYRKILKINIFHTNSSLSNETKQTQNAENSIDNQTINTTMNNPDTSVFGNTRVNKTATYRFINNLNSFMNYLKPITLIHFIYLITSYTFEPSQSPVTIGRSKCNINLSDNFLSKTHCKLEYNNNSWNLIDGTSDRPSKNGTW